MLEKKKTKKHRGRVVPWCHTLSVVSATTIPPFLAFRAHCLLPRREVGDTGAGFIAFSIRSIEQQA